MGTEPDEPKSSKQPGPLWAWILAFVLMSEGLKRVVIGWPIPPARDFDFGSRFLQNFGANLVLGLPVLIAYGVAWWWVNRRSK